MVGKQEEVGRVGKPTRLSSSMEPLSSQSLHPAGFDPSRFIAGGYRDANGDYWHVVFDERGNARCNSSRGHYTAAYADTFVRWRARDWTPEWELPRDSDGGDQ